jgi:molybdenum cofactor cytidylyltransferase
MASNCQVSGVILAAGGSSRLGRPKQLLDLFGEPLLRHVVRNAVASHLSEVILVLGHQSNEIATAIGDWGQRVVVNPKYLDGQSTSLQVGLSEVNPAASAVMFLLGDQPQVSPEIINTVIAHFLETNASIVMPTYGGIPANPVLFSAGLFSELATASGDEGARSIIKRHRSEIERVPVSLQTPPQDVDIEEDYEALLDVMALTQNPGPVQQIP